jgi:hypothetical protein
MTRWLKQKPHLFQGGEFKPDCAIERKRAKSASQEAIALLHFIQILFDYLTMLLRQFSKLARVWVWFRRAAGGALFRFGLNQKIHSIRSVKPGNG